MFLDPNFVLFVSFVVQSGFSQTAQIFNYSTTKGKKGSDSLFSELGDLRVLRGEKLFFAIGCDGSLACHADTQRPASLSAPPAVT